MQSKREMRDGGYILCWRNTKLNLKRDDKMKDAFQRGVIRHFLPSCLDNSPFPLRVAGGGGGGMGGGNTQKWQCQPFQSNGMFSIGKKKDKRKTPTKTTQLFLFPLNWVVRPFAVAMTTAAVLFLHLDLFPN